LGSIMMTGLTNPLAIKRQRKYIFKERGAD